MLEEYLNEIKKIKNEYLDKAIERQNKLVKPPKSLGNLEDIAVKISGIKECEMPILKKKRILVFAGDNGVVEDGVSCSPKSITYEQCINLTKGVTGCSSMASANGFDLQVYDIGVDFDFNNYYNQNEYYKKYKDDKNKFPFSLNRVVDKKIAKGTKNFNKEDAMTYENCERAIEIGIDAVKKAKEDGIDIIGIGEMGIGNTTTSSAILSFFSNKSVSELTGKGGGLLQKAFDNKIKIIEDFYNKTKKLFIDEINCESIIQGKTNESRLFNSLNYDSIIELLAKVGGYDIASMCGAYIGAAYYKIPVVIDGFISIVAAMLAVLMNNDVIDYLFASHISKEIGYNEAVDIINNKLYKSEYYDIIKISPMFDLKMRLGEGSGCVLAFQIIDTALMMHNNMLTFDDVNINDDYLTEIRKENF